MRTHLLVIGMILLCSLAADARVVYETGFENAGQLPEGWTVESHGPGPDWAVGGNQNNYLMRVRFGVGGEQDEWLVSPSLDLSGEQGVRVIFWHYFSTVGEGVAQVKISLDGGQTWELLEEFDQDTASEDEEILMPQADGQDDVRLCWRYLAYGDDKWEVDTVRIVSEVPVDMHLLGIFGPSQNDWLRVGADLITRLEIENLGSEPSPESIIRFESGTGVHEANLMGGLAPGESLMVTVTLPGSLFQTVGTETLDMRVISPGDAVLDNNELSVAPLHVIDTFPDPARVLLNYDDPADSALLADICVSRGITYDSWYRHAEGTESNLFGLHAWDVVCFTETQIYPSLPEQYSMMRFLDSGITSDKRSLLITGDTWMRYYQAFGSVSAEFVERYLTVTGGQEYDGVSPDLFPVPGNTMDLAQILSTTSDRPDIVIPHPQYPGGDLCLSYDENHEFGALVAISHPTYNAIAAGFEWGDLVTVDGQNYLAGACVDWLVSMGGDGRTGEIVPSLRLGPNPADSEIILHVPTSSPGQLIEVSLLDMAGRACAQWREHADDLMTLRLPNTVGSGVYCLVLDDDQQRHWSETVIVAR